MAKKQEGETWSQIGIRNVGLTKTLRALRYAMWWGLATAELKREPGSVEEFAQKMELNLRSAFREQQVFREAFPGQLTPGYLNQSTRAQAKYDATWRRLRNLGRAMRRKQAEKELEPVLFDLGAHVA